MTSNTPRTSPVCQSVLGLVRVRIVTIDATGAHQVRRRIAQRRAALDILNTVEGRGGVALQGVPGGLAKGIAQAALLAPRGKWIGAVQPDLSSGLMGTDTLA